MSKSDEQQRVRQEAGFVCIICRKSCRCMYAHITPDSANGEYKSDNLLFLCYECHSSYDYSIFHVPSQRNKVIEYLRSIKEKGCPPRTDITSIFNFFSDNLVVRIGAGITFLNTSSIFETEGPLFEVSPQNKILFAVKLQNGKLVLNGLFFDKFGNTLLKIKDNTFSTNGELLWDLILKANGELMITSADKSIWLQIKQNKDSSLSLKGKFFVGGSEVSADADGMSIRGCSFQDCIKTGGNGIIITPYSFKL